MNVNFNGYGENVATFIADTNVEPGCIVKMQANGKVTACANGNDFIGVCLSARDGYAAIQLSGYAEIASAAQLQLGYTGIQAASATSVKSADSGRKLLVVYASANTAGVIL